MMSTHLAGKVVVLGSTNWDICMYLPHIPAQGETVGGGRLQTNLGGKGANQAVACYLADAHMSFISCIGDDDTSVTVLRQLEAMGIDLSAVTQVGKASTGTACIFIGADAENCIGLTPGANAALSPQIVDKHSKAIADADVLLLQLETPIDTVQHAAKLAQENHTRVILNPAPAMSLPAEIYAYIDIMTPNRGELALLTGMPVDDYEQVRAAAHSLLAKGLDSVIVTLGNEGALWVTKDHIEMFPPYRVQPLDTTAAGDTFNGYLAAAVARNGDLAGAITMATAAAALSVTREGAIPSIPKKQEVEALINQATG